MGPFPIQINGTHITAQGMALHELHTRLRTAILNGEIPISMPVGFALNSARNVPLLSAIDRNHCCLEPLLAIATNVSNIILLGDMDPQVITEEQEGIVTTGNAVWRSKGRNDCYPINKDQYILTAVEPLSVKFIVRKACGFHSMADNADYMHNSAYFPLNTVHTLMDYVRVLPAYDKYVEVRYYNGMTAELFKRIWEEAQE